MTTEAGRDVPSLSDPSLAALLFGIDPVGLGGISLHGRAGPLRDRWLVQLSEMLGPEKPVRRLPLHAGDGRLFGGLDLTATLAAGRPVVERGILAETDGGVLILAMAERIAPGMAARLGGVLDTGVVVLERDGLAQHYPARLAMVALDEGIEEDEVPPMGLKERFGFWVELDGFDPGQDIASLSARLDEGRRLYPAVTIGDEALAALCQTALALGVDSLRAAVFAVRAARAAAALAGRSAAGHEDAALASRLVLAPRATRLPAEAAPQPDAETSEPAPDAADRAADGEEQKAAAEEPGDLVLAAAKAAIPPGLLSRLKAGLDLRRGRAAAGRAGPSGIAAKRGRPAGVRSGTPGDGARLSLIETLRAAAPWQRLRARGPAETARRIEIRRDDLRVMRLKQRTETVTVFVVDASGSLAVNRLAEAKGAIELLLAECYIRRDEVALMAFRGRSADLLLPPTRSLTRAKRCLADLPGGGATPLATAIDKAVDLAAGLKRRGRTPVLVFLTDGRANVARDGSTGRAKAEEEARQAARTAAAAGVRTLVVDAAPRPQPSAEALASAMRALYVPLPRADAGALSRAIGAVVA